MTPTLNQGAQVLYVPDHITNAGDMLMSPEVEPGIIYRMGAENTAYVIYLRKDEFLRGILAGWNYDRLYGQAVRTKAGSERTELRNLDRRDFAPRQITDYILNRWMEENGRS